MRDRERLITRIYDRGDDLRRQRLRVRSVAAGAGLTLVLGLASLGLVGGRDGGQVVTSNQGHRTTTTLALEPGPRPSTTPASPLPTTTSTSPSSTVAPAPSSTTTTLRCRNSSDARCGPFSYDPPLPPDRLPTITIAVEPLLPKVGDRVTFTITMDDPDGKPYNWCPTFVADAAGVDPAGSPAREQQRPPDGCVMVTGIPQYGRWDPPPPFHAVLTFHTTYQASGLHQAEFDTTEFGRCDRMACAPVVQERDVGVG